MDGVYHAAAGGAPQSMPGRMAALSDPIHGAAHGTAVHP